MFYFYNYFSEISILCFKKKQVYMILILSIYFLNNETYFSKNDKSASIIFQYVKNFTEIKTSINENINLISNICVKEV